MPAAGTKYSTRLTFAAASPTAPLLNADVGSPQCGDGNGRDLPDAAHSDVPRFVDAGLNGEDARQVDLIDLAISAFDLAADPQFPVFHIDGIHQGSEGIIEHGCQHSADLRSAILRLDSSQNQVVVTLPRETCQRGRDAAAVRAAECVIGDQYGLVRAHGQLTAQNFFVIVDSDRDHRDVAADAVANLQRFLDCIVVCLIHRIDELIALNIISGGIDFNLVLRRIRHSSCAN